MLNNKLVGMRINNALALRDKKQKELAKEIGVSDNVISYFCSGSRIPNTKQIYQIARFLNVSADYLLGITDQPSNDIKIREIRQYTGLSDVAINWLHQENEIPADNYLPAINTLFELDSLEWFCAAILRASEVSVTNRVKFMYEQERISQSEGRLLTPKEADALLFNGRDVRSALRADEEKEFLRYKILKEFECMLDELYEFFMTLGNEQLTPLWDAIKNGDVIISTEKELFGKEGNHGNN